MSNRAASEPCLGVDRGLTWDYCRGLIHIPSQINATDDSHPTRHISGWIWRAENDDLNLSSINLWISLPANTHRQSWRVTLEKLIQICLDDMNEDDNPRGRQMHWRRHCRIWNFEQMKHWSDWTAGNWLEMTIWKAAFFSMSFTMRTGRFNDH